MSLDSLDSVRAAAKAFLAQSPKLNILILNAGVMATPPGRTKDGFETQFGIDHLGHFLFFELLIPALLASSTPSFNSRVVSVSSLGHRCGEVRFHDLNFDEKDSYDPWVSYGQAKTANIYLASEIEKRYGAKGLHAVALNPGNIATNLSQYVDPEMIKNMTENEDFRRYLASPEQGAATSVYAAISKDLEGRGGIYLANCKEQGPVKPEATPLDIDDLGYAPYAFDEEKAAKLWKVSCELVGIDNSD
jgi:NAD(P)-dependent dehydrogenase (short-subunit alcohol dehydrogenase family)